jgi:hypothetical protein
MILQDSHPTKTTKNQKKKENSKLENFDIQKLKKCSVHDHRQGTGKIRKGCANIFWLSVLRRYVYLTVSLIKH